MKTMVTPFVRITWRGDDLEGKMRDGARDTMYEVGKQGEALAKSMAHVDIGNMQRATGMISPLGNTVYHRRGSWPPPTVNGTMTDVREFGDHRYTTSIGSLVNYAIYEELSRGHAFIGPAAAEVGKRWPEVARRNVRKHTGG